MLQLQRKIGDPKKFLVISNKNCILQTPSILKYGKIENGWYYCFKFINFVQDITNIKSYKLKRKNKLISTCYQSSALI